MMAAHPSGVPFHTGVTAPMHRRELAHRESESDGFHQRQLTAAAAA